MNPVTELDIAPLTWVRSEIDVALAHALEALDRAESGEAGADALRIAQNHVHQVQGALSIVGLDGVTQFAESLDALLGELAAGQIPLAATHLQLLRRATVALSNYLSEVADGARHQPLRLYPLYAELAQARGVDAPARGELFFPDLSARTLPLSKPITVDATRAAKEVRLQRSRFEKGLLNWLRAPASDVGPKAMLLAVRGISQLNAAPSARTFWWASIAFFDGLVQGAIKSDREAQRLCRRIDTQMRRLLEGAQVVAERLVRDVLFQVANAQFDSKHARAVRQAFQLDKLIPSAGGAQVVETPLAPLQRALHDALENAKEAWNRFAAGAAIGLPQMQEHLTAARKPLETLNYPDVLRLVDALHNSVSWLRKDPLKSNDDLAMDVATALLVAEQAVAGGKPDPKLPKQIDTLIKRLADRAAGRDPGALDDALFGEASRHAQERLFFNQLAREILLTLGQVEQTLDTYFRNPANSEPLSALAAPLKQVEGAFTMLGEPAAAALVRTNGERIAELATTPEPDLAHFEPIAHELSALGFFVEALHHGPATLERFLAPHGGAVASEAQAAPSVETAVLQQSREAQQLVQALSNAPADAELRAELKQNLETLREDAALLNDKRLEQQAREALDVLKTGGDSEKVKEAVAGIASAPAPAAPQVSQETMRLLDASTEQVDAELLEIFLEEAHEVLSTIHAHREAAGREPHDQENIVTIRRGFHTLKGSSRMVGLNDFADAAKAVEFAMNRWLQLELNAEPQLLALVDHATRVLDSWVQQLDSGGSPWKDASALIAEAEAFQASLDGEQIEAEPVLAAPQPVTPRVEEVVAPVRDEIAEEIADLSFEPHVGDTELDLTSTFLNTLGLDGGDSVADEAPVNFETTLLAPLGFDVNEPAEETSPAGPAVPATNLMAPIQELDFGPEASDHQFMDLTSSLIAALETGETAVEAPEETLNITIDELSLSDENSLGAPKAEEEVDLTATLLAPLAMRDAIYGTAEPEPATQAPAELPALASAPSESPVLDEAPDTAVAQLLENEQDFFGEPLAEQEFDLTATLLAPQGVHDAIYGAPADEGAPEPDEVLPELAVHEFVDETSGSEHAAAAAEEDVSAGGGLALEQTEDVLDAAADAEEEPTVFDLTTTDLDGPAARLAEFGVPTHDVALELPSSWADELSELDGIEPPESGSIALDNTPPEPEIDQVRLGDTAISRPLYEMYITEACQHIGKLKEGLPQFVSNPLLVPQDPIVRAAHTLGGISGTARIEAVRALAKGLEHALLRLQHANVPPSTTQAELICACGERLQAMVSEIGERKMPLETPELVAALELINPEVDTSERLLAAYGAMAQTPDAETAQTSSPPPQSQIESLSAASPAEPLAAPKPQQQQPSREQEEPVRAVAVKDDLDEQLLPIFFEEVDELSRDLSLALRDMREADDPVEPANAVARLLHTLKGSARMAGAMTVGEYVHGIENRLLQARDKNQLNSHLADELEAYLDSVGQMVERMQASLSPVAEEAPSAGDQSAAAQIGGTGAAELERRAAKLDELEAQSGQRTLLRVRADLVDRFVNEAGEISIARTRIEGELRTLRRSMLDLTENVIRLRNQLREVEIAAETQMQARVAQAEIQHAEFDPLEFDRFTRFQEVTRMMAESVGDVTTIQQNLLKNLDAADTALHAQGRLSRDLQQALMGVRMVPFDELSDRMYRIVRQTAKELGKRANLDIRGGEIEIDRSVLDKMTAPVEHLLRNAVAHGLESPEERRKAGKDEIGQITLSIVQRANEVSIELADDGRGLDYAKIQSRAEERGLVQAGEQLPQSRLKQLIFEPGFTTVDKVSGVAGRGVGMDVVKNETISVGGRIDVESTTGKGARFIVHLPLTLAVTNALLVRAGERTFAIPSNMVEQALELRQESLDVMRAAGGTERNGRHYAFRYLPQVLGDNEAQPVAARMHWVLLLRSGHEVLALHVDEMRGNQEIVVKNAGPQFTRLQGFSGATVLPDGEISLILNPVVLAGIVPAVAPEEITEAAAPAASAYVPTVMVVDDSMTVRKITGRLLEREGYRVVTAKDGVDALEQLVDVVPDVMLLDIEMPRMNGFDLARNIRADERLKKLPIIMITSRMADKHRNYALEIGVNHYLGKPYDEEKLLSLIEEFVKS
ncbi:MAG: Hpt domain-containing protein [Betaproteobacteria bacterium]|nr:Hpt domain-containing protein [Betaproteobacteria bacterium]